MELLVSPTLIIAPHFSHILRWLTLEQAIYASQLTAASFWAFHLNIVPVVIIRYLVAKNLHLNWINEMIYKCDFLELVAASATHIMAAG